jgi:hypothetical protein
MQPYSDHSIEFTLLGLHPPIAPVQTYNDQVSPLLPHNTARITSKPLPDDRIPQGI